MTRPQCLTCAERGKRSKKGDTEKLLVIHDPQRGIGGRDPRVGYHGAIWLVDETWTEGIESVMRDRDVSREEILIAHWWAGIYGCGTRILRKRYGDWAGKADLHLFFGCINFPDPPTDTRT